VGLALKNLLSDLFRAPLETPKILQ